MPPNVPVRVALSHSNDGAVSAAFNQVTPQILREPFDGRLANFTLHPPNAVRRKIADNASMAVKDFIPIVKQPIADQRWNSALLGALGGVARAGIEHDGP